MKLEWTNGNHRQTRCFLKTQGTPGGYLGVVMHEPHVALGQYLAITYVNKDHPRMQERFDTEEDAKAWMLAVCTMR